ncbi:MAG: DUF4912 domain-containing protein [Nitrospirae bacterium]|nr:DUF4912 domain-containing protein [Nitrospirota bacterium]MCL5976556.1 DUF4912 domain-containing protein [Nitrospirota bacterium]
MKKQKTTEKGISKAKNRKKTASKPEKKELIRALSGKPAKPTKKTPAKKAAKTKKAAAPKKAVKKTIAKKIKPAIKKPAKKTKTTKATTKTKTVKKAVAKATPKKPVKKTPVKKAAVKKTPIKKVPVKKAVKPVKKEIKKPLEELSVTELKTLAKELGISLKPGLKKADIIKVISKPKAKAVGKPAPEKIKKAAPKPETKKAIKKIEPIKEAAKAEKPTMAEERKPLPPEKYEEMPPLPVGYDADKAVSMPVTPRQLYVYWEITEKTLSQYIGSLNIKVTNLKTKAFFYTPISERIGEHFLAVAPEGEYAVEIGIIDYKGNFVPIVRSQTSETPVSGMAPKEAKKEKEAEEIELPEEFFETPESISSY